MNSFGKLNHNLNETEAKVLSLANDSINQQYPSFYQQLAQTNITPRPFTFGPNMVVQPAIIDKHQEATAAITAQHQQATAAITAQHQQATATIAAQPVAQLVAQPVAQSVAQPVAQSVAQSVAPKLACHGITMNPSSDLTFKQAMDNLQKSRNEKLKQEEKSLLIDTLYAELTLIRSQIDKLNKSTDTIYEILRKF